jgi:adenylate kinase family enzyme
MRNRIVLFHEVTTGTPCPKCDGKLARRDDDAEEALDRRRGQFRKYPLPVARHYQGKGLPKEGEVRTGRDAVFNPFYEDMLGGALE